MKQTIVALVGPTGSGKTETAIEIAKRMNAEIISMDSMQIYRRMDIGTAKPTREQMAQIPHHLIDIAEPDEIFTVSAYRKRAYEAAEDILNRGKLPLFVGGTGLYLNAISFEMNFGENSADEERRKELHQIAEQTDGPQRLHDLLRKIDSESAAKLHPNDIRRVIRAIEIFEQSGKAKSDHASAVRREGPYHTLVYGLSMPREAMYARINERVEEMFSGGLIEEVQALLDSGIEPRAEGGAMQAIGYKEVVSALRGEITMERAKALIQQGSRRYAKRQWTWFRHDDRVQWFDWSDFTDRQSLIERLISKIQQDTKNH